MPPLRVCRIASVWEDKRKDIRAFTQNINNIHLARKAQPYHRRSSPLQEELIDRLRKHYFNFADTYPEHSVCVRLHRLLEFNLDSDARILVPILKNGIFDEEAIVCVDFANKNLGGGYLSYGMAQEEVMFLERLDIGFFVAKKYAEGQPLRIGSDEAMTISGGHQYAALNFYGRTPFDYMLKSQFYSEPKPKGPVIAIDCLRPDFQKYKEEDLMWMLRKAYVGFQAVEEKEISTGHWGGGVFLNNKSVIFCLQSLAAALAGKSLKYYTCGQECPEGVALVGKWYREGTSVRDAFAQLVHLCDTNPAFITAWKPNADTWKMIQTIPGR